VEVLYAALTEKPAFSKAGVEPLAYACSLQNRKHTKDDLPDCGILGLIICSAQSSAKSETVLPSAPRKMPGHCPSWAVWVAIHPVLRPTATTEWSSAVLTVPQSAFDGMRSPLHAYAVPAEAASAVHLLQVRVIL